MKKLSLILCILICWIISAVAQKSENNSYKLLINEYKELIKSEMQKNNVAGLSIALVDKNEVIWSEGFGYENLKDSIKATENTLYCIGSITKLFTATALMQLAENGKLDIDKPITK